MLVQYTHDDISIKMMKDQWVQTAKSPPEGNLMVRGDVFLNASRLEAMYGHSLSINSEVLANKPFICDCKLFTNIYIDPNYIIAGALLMFSARGCVLDILPRECIEKYCPLGSISQSTPKGAGGYCKV